MQPWGLRENGTAFTTKRERDERARLGEAAIALLERLGVSVEWLEEIAKSEDPIATLERLRGGGDGNVQDPEQTT